MLNAKVSAHAFFIAGHIKLLATVLPSQILLSLPFPGDFHGVSTRPTCFGGSKALICNSDDDILGDEECGDEGDSVDPSKFLAWSSSSRITLQCEAEGNVAAVRQVNLCFYHDPDSGVGLPDFRLSASDLVSQLGDPLSYWSQDPPSDSPGVRNVTLVLTEQITANFFTLASI